MDDKWHAYFLNISVAQFYEHRLQKNITLTVFSKIYTDLHHISVLDNHAAEKLEPATTYDDY